jgi:hypothetical protein
VTKVIAATTFDLLVVKFHLPTFISHYGKGLPTSTIEPPRIAKSAVFLGLSVRFSQALLRQDCLLGVRPSSFRSISRGPQLGTTRLT